MNRIFTFRKSDSDKNSFDLSAVTSISLDGDTVLIYTVDQKEFEIRSTEKGAKDFYNLFLSTWIAFYEGEPTTTQNTP
jgi:hypothetical protein